MTHFKDLLPWKNVRRVVIGVAGGAVLVLGFALIVLPGPAFLVIPAGLAILALEFAWARSWLRSAKAVMPRRAKSVSTAQRKFTLQSVARGAGFLFRQVARTVWPKGKAK